MTFPCNSIVRNERNSNFNKIYGIMSPFIEISVTEIYEQAYLH